MSTLVECVPNFSEGCDQGRVDAIVAAMKMDGVYLLDREMDADHNRSVITLVGEREAIQEAAIRGVGKAAELIDLCVHKGAHPRMGAANVVPFIPIDGVTIEDCVAMARHVGEEIWKRHQIPVYLYEAAASTPERQNLENIRRGQFEGIRAEIATNVARKPDFGEPRVHPTAGATVVGARKFLIAYNLYLDSGGPNAEEKGVLRSAAFAKELGFETFVVDAMWFPQSGAWYWDPKRFPNGHKPIEEYVHDQGMKFGIWMAYTQGSSSDDPRALNIKDHPDWFNAPPKLDPEGHINWDAQIDLGYDPARDWAERSSQRVVSEYRIDYFKTDYTPIVTKCIQTNHRHHYGVDVSYWSTLGYYAVQEALLAKFPNLINEGCSGSGHIKDFGDIQRVHMIAINDTLSSLPNRQAIYDSTFAFPPSVLMDYTYENFYDTVSDAPEPYFWRSSMMNQWQIDPTHSASWTPEQRANVKKATDIYKSWVRPILQDVHVHHILPRPDGIHWDGMFYWSPSLKRGTLYIFRPNSNERMQHVVLKGLGENTNYTVRSEDHSTPDATYSGKDLITTGLTIQLPARYTSDLLYLEEAH